jgi:hypothetical protein
MPSSIISLICLTAVVLLTLGLEYSLAMPVIERTVNILQFAPTTTTRYIDIKNESLEVVVDSARTVKKLQFEEMPRPPPKTLRR